jgi:hypothetical protein
MAASKPRVEHGPTDDGYLSLRALATYSDMSVRSLRDYLTDATNPIPHYRMKGKILVKRSEFDAWMSTHRVRADESLVDMVDDVMEARRRSIVHVLRHTFGSLLIQQRESLAYVKEQMVHASIQITVDVYGHLVPGGNRSAVDRVDSRATNDNPATTGEDLAMTMNDRKSFVLNGEPPRNRTENPQIKSLLLCQLS